MNVVDCSSSLELSVAIKSPGGLYSNVTPALSKRCLASRKRANVRYARLKATDTETEDDAPDNELPLIIRDIDIQVSSRVSHKADPELQQAKYDCPINPA
jgi:hypothetical protein